MLNQLVVRPFGFDQPVGEQCDQVALLHGAPVGGETRPSAKSPRAGPFFCPGLRRPQPFRPCPAAGAGGSALGWAALA